MTQTIPPDPRAARLIREGEARLHARPEHTTTVTATGAIVADTIDLGSASLTLHDCAFQNTTASGISPDLTQNIAPINADHQDLQISTASTFLGGLGEALIGIGGSKP